MEENFDSSNSTLTHCVNSAAWKRKRDESDCDTTTSHPLPVKMYDKNHSELFQQLVYARLLQPPYAKYKGRWEDINLWNKIVRVAYMNDRYSQPTPIGAMQIVLKYGGQYMKDPQLQNMEDSPLKKNICIMFTPSITQEKYLHYDGIQKLVEVGMEKQRAGLLPIVPELGVKGGLAVQFGEDVEHLKLSSDEMMLLIPEYGPTSPTYVLMANWPADQRRDLLRAFVTKLGKNLSRSSARSSTGSSTKKRIKP